MASLRNDDYCFSCPNYTVRLQVDAFGLDEIRAIVRNCFMCLLPRGVLFLFTCMCST